MHPLLIAAAASYGALAGSLLVRPGYRLAVEPEEPWRSACPAGHPLGARPRGWLGTGRCAACGGAGAGAVSAYGAPPVRLAAVTAVVCAALAVAVGARPELVVWLLAVPAAVLLATVDFAVQRLPDVLTLPLAVAVAAGLGVAALLPGAGGSWRGALFGGAVLTGVYFVLFLINPRGMGFGDVKLAASIGVVLGWYGWSTVFFGTLVGFLLAAGYGFSLVIAGGAGRGRTIPFGPFMALGALVALLLGGLAA
ncbi:A24 family peptidase [Streptomyces sp. NBC_01803]|uniref:A24 family peptidase n=1 Tax=Streptomyces sp. NBC_01803 TaxID=2975946 RepID=UPI002DDAF637|nr:A24 family peptidase [Streptomyces sp. NBC_01803]WSA45964.1 A24 family peptidase [Streptomyces sp. NBC_01803]